MPKGKGFNAEGKRVFQGKNIDFIDKKDDFGYVGTFER